MDNKYIQLARKTKEWAEINGCIRDDDGKISQYFTIRKGKKRNKPYWGKQFPVSDWRDMRLTAHELRTGLALHPSKGWFFGNSQDTAQTVASELNGTLTRIESRRELMEYALMAGDDELLQSLTVKLKGDCSPDIFLNSVKGLFLAIGEPYQESFVSYLLNAHDEKD